MLGSHYDSFRLTAYLIAINTAAFIFQIIFPSFMEMFYLQADQVLTAPWQLVTYMFMHGSILHIFFNMFVLLIFGSVLERVIGGRKYLFLYFVSGIGSALIYILLMSVFDPAGLAYPMLGASGAIFGVMAAYAFKFPKSWVYIFGLIPLPAWLLIIFFLVEETFFGVLGFQSGIANFGHVGGILCGLAIMSYWKWRSERKKPREFRGFQFIWE